MFIKKKQKNKKGHHAKPKRASATSPLRTWADMCRTGVGAGSRARADKGPDRRQSNHESTDDQAGRRRLANTDSNGGSLVHAADDTPSKNAATGDTLQLHAPRGGTSQGSSRVEEEWYETSRSSHSRGTIRRKCRKQHRRRMVRPKTCLKEVIPEERNRQRASRAQSTRAFKQQVFVVHPGAMSRGLHICRHNPLS